MNIKPVVFIPCFNASKTIVETLESVKHAIRSTGQSIPVYIFNDRSSDSTQEVLMNYCSGESGLHVIENELNVGERKTTNDAVNLFTGKFDWMFIIHADDIVRRDWLTVLIKEVEENINLPLFTVWSSFDTFNSASGERTIGDNSGAVQKKHRTQEEIKRYILKINSSWHISGAAISIGAYQQIGGFDETLAQFGDSDFFVRGLLKGYTDIYISRTLTDYRILSYSVSAVSSNTNRDIREVYILLGKFSSVLDHAERRILIAFCLKTSGKRALKALYHLNWSKAKANMTAFAESVGHYFKGK